MQTASMSMVLTGPDPLLFGLWRDLDANGLKVTNLADGILDGDAATYGQVKTIAGSVDDALAAAAAAEASLQDLLGLYLGSFPNDAAANAAAGGIVQGQLYWNTTSSEMRVRDGVSWQGFGGGIADLSIVDQKVAAFNSATSVRASKIAYVPGWAGSTIKPLIARFTNQIHVSEANVAGDAVTDDRAELKKILDYAASVNNTLLLDAKNYKINAPLKPDAGSWRSFKIKGAGTGNHQTPGSGTNIITNGTYNALEVEFATFANENFVLEGLGFYNQAMDLLSGGFAVKVIRGANNGSRYVGDFVFRDVFAHGFAVAFNWQGMNTANSGLNFFGRIVLDHVTVQNCGYFWRQANASCNLVGIMNSQIFSCIYGGFYLVRDGDVGGGNGKGSMISATLLRTNAEGSGGLFQTGTGVDVGVGVPIRSKFHLIDFTREGCGASGAPGNGDPFGLGSEVDLLFSGHNDDHIPHGENSLPYIPAGATIQSESAIHVVMNGGRSKSPRSVNAPRMAVSLAAAGAPGGADSYTFKVEVHSTKVNEDFAIKTEILMANGVYGYREDLHTGRPSGTTTSTVIVNGGTGGISVSFGSGDGDDLLVITVTNTSGFVVPCEVKVVNMSSSSIITPST